MAVAPTAGADTFCVERPGCPDPGDNFTTIQQAIAAADANDPPSPPFIIDLILVGNGVFHEAVTEGVTTRLRSSAPGHAREAPAR